MITSKAKVSAGKGHSRGLLSEISLRLGTFAAFVSTPTTVQAATVLRLPQDPPSFSNIPQSGIGDARPRTYAEDALTINVQGDTWRVPLRHTAADRRKFVPASTIHLKVNPDRGDTVFGLDYSSKLGKVGVQLRFATCTGPLLELGQLKLAGNSELQRSLDIVASDLSIAPEELVAVGVRLRHKDLIVGECYQDNLSQFDLISGFAATMYLPANVAQELIASPTSTAFVFDPFVAANNVQTRIATHSVRGGKELETKVRTVLTNNNGQVQTTNILQGEVDKVAEVIRVHLRSEIYGESPEALALVDISVANVIGVLFESSPVSGAAATTLADQPEYKAMMATWLEALKQECKISDSRVVYTELVDGKTATFVDTDKIIKMISEDLSLAPFWGFMGGEAFQRMDSAQKEKTIIDKVVSSCKNSTGTTLTKSDTKPYYEIHSVEVSRLLDSSGVLNAASVSYVTLVTADATRLVKARSFGLAFTDVAINSALEPQVAQLQAARQLRERDDQRQRAENERLQKIATEQATVSTLVNDRRNAIRIGWSRIQERLRVFQSYQTKLAEALTSVPALAQIVYDTDQQCAVAGGHLQGYKEVRSAMLDWKGDFDAGERRLAEKFWDDRWYNDLAKECQGTIDTHRVARDSALAEIKEKREELARLFKELPQDDLNGANRELRALRELVIQPLEVAGVQDPSLVTLLARANRLQGEMSDIIRHQLAETDSLILNLTQVAPAAEQYFNRVGEAIVDWAGVTENECRRGGRRMALEHGHIALHDDNGGRDDEEANRIRGCMLFALEGRRLELRVPISGARFSSGHADRVADAQNADLSSHRGIQTKAKNSDRVRDRQLEALRDHANELSSLLTNRASRTRDLQAKVMAFININSPNH